MTLVANPLETLNYNAGVGPAIAASAETIVATTDVIQAYSNPADEQPGGETIAPTVVRPVILDINLNITAGTGTTAIIVRVRQGTTVGGTLVNGNNTFTVTLAAGATGQFHFKTRDTSGVPFAPGGTAYVVTVAQTAGTAIGACNDFDVEVRQ